MGGIFAAVSRRGSNVVGDVAKGLLRLRYRGCDCAGVAALVDSKIVVRKDRGDIAVLAEKLFEGLSSSVVLGHTRFSTHGRPHPSNAHPHTGCGGVVAVAGDGVIANYEELRDELMVRGHSLRSRCDFEVVAHLVEDEMKRLGDPFKAFIEAVKKLEGVFSLAVMVGGYPEVYCYTLNQPLYIGESAHAYYVSSTRSALYQLASSYTVLDSGTAARVSVRGVEAYKLTKEEAIPVQLVFEKLEVDPALVEKDGFPHFMLKEIHEVPNAILRALMAPQKRYRELAARLVAHADKVYIIGNGSSLHAGMLASYYLTELAGVTPIVLSAAEFPLYHINNVTPGTLVIAVSQSGETGDVIKAVYEAKLHGATILGITNNISSRLANLSSLFLPVAAGLEISIPATKTFTATLVTLYQLALDTARYQGKISPREVEEKRKQVYQLAKELEAMLPRMNEEAKKAALKVKASSSGYTISRGLNYPLALEASLKLKEAAYFHAEGVEAGEFRHGPITLVDKSFTTLFIVPAEAEAAEATIPLVEDAYEREAIVVLVGDRDSLSLIEKPVEKITAPQTPRHLKPIAYSVPIQLLAYHLGVLRGCPIDKPKKLVKAVTEPS